MKKSVASILLVFLSVAAFNVLAKDKSEHGVFRPTTSNNPKKYLREFQLGKATQDEIIQYVGTPDKSFSAGGSDFLTYNVAPKQHASGVIEYTYEIKDSVVVNVTYLNSGNFFGVTQRESAKTLQGTP